MDTGSSLKIAIGGGFMAVPYNPCNLTTSDEFYNRDIMEDLANSPSYDGSFWE